MVMSANRDLRSRNGSVCPTPIPAATSGRRSRNVKPRAAPPTAPAASRPTSVYTAAEPASAPIRTCRFDAITATTPPSTARPPIGAATRGHHDSPAPPPRW